MFLMRIYWINEIWYFGTLKNNENKEHQKVGIFCVCISLLYVNLCMCVSVCVCVCVCVLAIRLYRTLLLLCGSGFHFHWNIFVFHVFIHGINLSGLFLTSKWGKQSLNSLCALNVSVQRLGLLILFYSFVILILQYVVSLPSTRH